MTYFFLVFFASANFSLSQKIYTIQSCFLPPTGFQRVAAAGNTNARYFRSLPLLPENSPVRNFCDKIFKSAADTVLAAVVDYSIREKKLEQCVDIILRFYAEYLWSQQRQDRIVFCLPGGYSL